jgi:hypothetical protein
MGLIFKNVEPGEDVNVLTWDQVQFKDGNENKYPVKKIVITIEAGEIAHMMVERYMNSGDPFLDSSAKTEDIDYGYAPTTFKHFYAIGEIENPLSLTVAGPLCKNGMMNGLKHWKNHK